MSWQDFDADSSLERDLLERALPLVPTIGDGSSVATIDMATGTRMVGISVTDTLGATPAACVDLLRIRPLLVGAAWKVLDLLIETALEEAGLQSDLNRGWSIKRKVEHAAAGDARPGRIGDQTWTALTKSYVETVDIRHSLVHRRAHTDAANALVGVDEHGAPIRPMTAGEQEAFARAALRAAQLVAATAPDDRVAADLIRQLAELTTLHGEQLPVKTMHESLPELRLIVDPDGDASDRYVLDIPALKKNLPFGDVTYADLTVLFRDRPGQELHGRLEQAPDEVVIIDADKPTGWLH